MSNFRGLKTTSATPRKILNMHEGRWDLHNRVPSTSPIGVVTSITSVPSSVSATEATTTTTPVETRDVRPFWGNLTIHNKVRI